MPGHNCPLFQPLFATSSPSKPVWLPKKALPSALPWVATCLKGLLPPHTPGLGMLAMDCMTLSTALPFSVALCLPQIPSVSSADSDIGGCFLECFLCFELLLEDTLELYDVRFFEEDDGPFPCEFWSSGGAEVPVLWGVVVFDSPLTFPWPLIAHRVLHLASP